MSLSKSVQFGHLYRNCTTETEGIQLEKAALNPLVSRWSVSFEFSFCGGTKHISPYISILRVAMFVPCDPRNLCSNTRIRLLTTHSLENLCCSFSVFKPIVLKIILTITITRQSHLGVFVNYWSCAEGKISFLNDYQETLSLNFLRDVRDEISSRYAKLDACKKSIKEQKQWLSIVEEAVDGVLYDSFKSKRLG